MEIHRGQIVETQVRKEGVNISELCRQLGISRSMLYKWFGQCDLKLQHVYRIGVALNYDFGNDIPDLSSHEVKCEMAMLENPGTDINEADDEVWKDKYVGLLEQFVILLELKKAG